MTRQYEHHKINSDSSFNIALLICFHFVALFYFLVHATYSTVLCHGNTSACACLVYTTFFELGYNAIDKQCITDDTKIDNGKLFCINWFQI